jgi:hypothetical protein
MNDDQNRDPQSAPEASGLARSAPNWSVASVAELLVDDALPIVHVTLIDRPQLRSRQPNAWDLLAELLCEV